MADFALSGHWQRRMLAAVEHYRFVILGAGPAGLAAAATLRGLGVESLLLLEKQETCGGLCRSDCVDGAPLDIGGGHFLDLRRKHVLEFLFEYMPREEWNQFDRIARIRIHGVEVDHPFEANLWQLPTDVQVAYLESIAAAGCVRGTPQPESFEQWIAWKFGERIAADYMLPYNRKIWSLPLEQLGTYWLYKLPDVSFRDTLRSCIERKPVGALPAHGTFLYPKKYGYGEVWRRIGESLNGKLATRFGIQKIDLKEKTINGTIRFDYLVTSIPWTVWPAVADLPKEIVSAISELRYCSVDIDYVPADAGSPAHWIYLPDEKCAAHRILTRHNFCPGSRGHWTETNSRRAGAATGPRFHNEYAYPVNTVGKPAAAKTVMTWARSEGIFALGRWGTWEHMNSDVAVEAGMQLGKELAGLAR